MDTTFERVKAIVMDHLRVEEVKVTWEANFIDDLSADSLDLAALQMAVEEAFEIEIPDDDAEALLTVGDAVNYIQDKTGAA